MVINEPGFSANWVSSLRRRDGGKRIGFVREKHADEIGDAVAFARDRLGFQPDAAQERVLRGGRRGIVNCTRQWGKSTVMAAKAVHRAWSEAGSLVLVLSPSLRQSGEFLRKAEEFTGRLGIKVKSDGDNKLSIAFPNRSRIVGLPANEATTRGFSNVSLMLVDEAAWVPDRVCWAMRPTLATGDGDLWLVSTPNGKRGFFYEEWQHGSEDWQRISVTGPDCPRIKPSFLVEERRKDEQRFRREYLCEFGEVEGAVFSPESIEAAFEDFEGIEI